MASRTSWKQRTPGAAAAAAIPAVRSPSPPPRSSVEWFAEADVSDANNRLYHRLHSYRKRRHDGKERLNGRIAGYGGPAGAMDALAYTALSSGNSATASNQQQQHQHQHRHSASAADSERPAKRVRSENHWSTAPLTSAAAATPNASATLPTAPGRRPTTSYVQTSPSSQLEDAALLMNFVEIARTTAGRVASSSSSHVRSASFGANTFSTIPASQIPHEPLPHYQSPFDHPPTELQSEPPPTAKTLPSSRTDNADGNIASTAAHSVNLSKSKPANGMSADEEKKSKAAGSHHDTEKPVSNGTAETTNSIAHNPPGALPSAELPESDSGLKDDMVLDSDATQPQDAPVENGLPSNDVIAAADKSGDTGQPGNRSSKEETANTRENGNYSADAKQGESVRVKKESGDTPQVCAACNFHRNNLTLDTESEATSWISCDGCNRWFHFACAGFKTMREVRSVDKYRCKTCRPIHGPTTYVRKSARAHAPIDYAELNQGVVKTSDESPEHHYIKPIKEGSIKFTPENFARIRPELATSDFWLRGDGMREPVVIPADWNPPARTIPVPEQAPDDAPPDQDPADDGLLHDQSALDGDMADRVEFEQVPDEGQDLLDMVIPRGLTVRRVAELYGPEEKIEVIDVKSQNGEDRRWNMRKWADYYESTAPNKPVRNVISLEVSQSQLGRLIRRPRVVRDLDLQDAVWPPELIARGDYPKVQFYCLMSVADCYTDFHIDFGGSSVYYHILRGSKTFFFIPPTDANLKKYEDWCNSEAQNYTFLGDQTKVCYRVDLGPGDTMLIPAGWIHAVWTPEDSLVIGGNFLTRQNYSMQIRVTQIEKATKVPLKFRYPYFQKIMWYTMLDYLADDPIPDSVVDLLTSGRPFNRERPVWDDYDHEDTQEGQHGEDSGEGKDAQAKGNDQQRQEEAQPGSEDYNARYYAKCELDGLPELVRYLQRTAYIVAGYVTEGVSSDTKRAVQRSIPKEHKQHGSEPVDCVRKFAMWCAWKRGNETIPHWAYPDHVPELNAPEVTQKKLSAAHIRRLEREAAMSAQRVSDRPQREKKPPANLYNEIIAEQEKTKATKASSPATTNGTKLESEPPLPPPPPPPAQVQAEIDAGSTPAKKEPQPRKRRSTGSTASRQPACETCRKGRRACKHRESQASNANGDDRPMTATSQDDAGSRPTTAIKMEDVQMTGLVNGSAVTSEPTTPDAKSSAAAAANKTPGTGGGSITSPSSKEPLTPSRAKACAECRKSKVRFAPPCEHGMHTDRSSQRRCVHDEYGRQDPIKMAQLSHSRPSTGKRKRNSDAAADAVDSADLVPPTKESDPPGDASAEAPNGNASDSAVPAPAAVPMPASAASLTSVVNPETQQPTPVMPSETLSQTDEEAKGHQQTTEIATANGVSTATENGDTQPPSALVSPPESADTDHERTASPTHSQRLGTSEGEKQQQHDFTPPTTTASEPRSRRPSQLVPPAAKIAVVIPPVPANSTSPERSTRSRAVSTASIESSRGKASSGGSNNANVNGKASSPSAAVTDGTDEDTMKLIHEMIAQDRGLRTRRESKPV